MNKKIYKAYGIKSQELEVLNIINFKIAQQRVAG